MERQDRKKLLADYKQQPKICGICAIKNMSNGKMWIETTLNMEGRRNRFEFIKSTNSGVPPLLRDDWQTYGPQAFCFEVLEELKRGETQTDAEFAEDLKVLKEMWVAKFKAQDLY
ncbi:MAG: GIY-YIG nuclease family protein [Elusimicrobiota bacterium]|jgi:hypothetical protein|nr:GIY-YIG nuclease family protein [Elusimicrobiota bacterium]